MGIKEYDREKAIEYANKWAYTRNPDYYNYDQIGGDCTNFVSQCIYAGSGVMNYSNNGWNYKNANDKSPSWERVSLGYNRVKSTNSPKNSTNSVFTIANFNIKI